MTDVSFWIRNAGHVPQDILAFNRAGQMEERVGKKGKLKLRLRGVGGKGESIRF